MKTNNENKELNKDSNKDLTKKSKKESNSKKFKKIDFKELQRKSKEKRIQNKKNLKHGSYSMGAITIFIAIIVVLNLVLQEVRRNFTALVTRQRKYLKSSIKT